MNIKHLMKFGSRTVILYCSMVAGGGLAWGTCLRVARLGFEGCVEIDVFRLLNFYSSFYAFLGMIFHFLGNKKNTKSSSSPCRGRWFHGLGRTFSNVTAQGKGCG